MLGWKAGREGHPLATQNWLNGWTCIPQERRLLTICVNRISNVFFLLFWNKILAVQMKFLGCHSENNLLPCAGLHHQKFCLCRTISVQAFSQDEEKGDKEVSKT